MKRKIFSTKEFWIKAVVSILVLTFFCVLFVFSSSIESVFGLSPNLCENEVEYSSLEDSSYKVHYLDVGQGNCVVVELPKGKTMIIDGGSDMFGEKLTQFLRDKNISKIDYMIATHADTDHIGGLNYLFDKFEIVNIFRPMQIAGTEVLYSSSSGDDYHKFEVYEHEDLKEIYETLGSKKFVEATSERYREFIRNIYDETYTLDGEVYKSNVTVFYDGLKIAGSGFEFEFFAPLKASDEVNFADTTNTSGFLTKTYSNDDSNNSSAIFLLNILGDKYFFSGDASAAEETENHLKFEETDFVLSLSQSERQRLSGVDVYLVAHHGSEYSSSKLMLDLINPKFAVVSVGKNNFGHPNENIISRLKSLDALKSDGLIKTLDDGTITFSNVNGEVVYAKESSQKVQNLTISVEILLIILLIVAETFVFCIKPIEKNKLTTTEDL